jgi:ParB family chromosome partitioning protein
MRARRIHPDFAFSGVTIMNAVTQTEVLAVQTAAPLEAPDPSKHLMLVPLAQLLPRTAEEAAIRTLSA